MCIKVQTSFIRFLVDISGTPKPDKKSGNYQKVIIANTSIDRYNFDTVSDEFKEEFPSYWNKKGHKLQPHRLEEIVDFLNRKNIRMITVQFDVPDWEKYKAKYISEGHLEEKIMGILYYYVLKRVASKKHKYSALIDFDTQFDIKESITIVQRIARERNYNFDINFGYIDINPELKFPDWVASAARKCTSDDLKKYKHFIMLKNFLPYYHIQRAF